MVQEDNLRALGKIMDFMQGISVLFLLINSYWFCYSACASWHITLEVIDKILLNFQRTTGLFSSVLWTKLFCVVFLVLSCLGTKGVKEEKITWGMIYSALSAGFVFSSSIGGYCFAYLGSGSCVSLHLLTCSRLYLSLDGWSVDESSAEKQSGERCLQPRK